MGEGRRGDVPQIGIPELLIILFIIIVIFGVGRLPELGGALGKGIKEFRSAVRDSDSAEERQK